MEKIYIVYLDEEMIVVKSTDDINAVLLALASDGYIINISVECVKEKLADVTFDRDRTGMGDYRTEKDKLFVSEAKFVNGVLKPSQ